MAETRAQALLKEATVLEVTFVSRLETLESTLATQNAKIDKNIAELLEVIYLFANSKGNNSIPVDRVSNRTSPTPVIPISDSNPDAKSGTQFHYSGITRLAIEHHALLKSEIDSFLTERFDKILDDPISELKQLQETNGIVEYHSKFELLRSRVNLSEEDLVTAFLAGLRVDTQSNVRMFQPQTIGQCLMLGRLYETAHPKQHIVVLENSKAIHQNSLCEVEDEVELDNTKDEQFELHQEGMNGKRARKDEMAVDKREVKQFHVLNDIRNRPSLFLFVARELVVNNGSKELSQQHEKKRQSGTAYASESKRLDVHKREWEPGGVLLEHGYRKWTEMDFKRDGVLSYLQKLQKLGLPCFTQWDSPKLCHGYDRDKKGPKLSFSLKADCVKLLDCLDSNFGEKNSQKRIGIEELLIIKHDRLLQSMKMTKQACMELIGSNSWVADSWKRKLCKTWSFKYKESTMAWALPAQGITDSVIETGVIVFLLNDLFLLQTHSKLRAFKG